MPTISPMQPELAAISDLLDVVCASKTSVYPGCATPDGVGLFQSEADIAADYVESRRLNFLAGRAAARAALGRTGHAAVPVLSDQDGVPSFPAGVVGSISHKHGFGVAVVGFAERWQGIGVDLEYDALDADEDALLDRVAVGSERPIVAPLLAAGLKSPATWLLCAKEAVYKALFPTTRDEFDYEDLILSLDPARQGGFRVETLLDQSRENISGIYGLSRGWLVCLVLVEKPFDNRT